MAAIAPMRPSMWVPGYHMAYGLKTHRKRKPPASSSGCPADFDGDCSVGIFDLLMLLANWG